MDDYERACDASEIRVHVTDRTALRRLLGSLELDKRRSGFLGRATVRKIPEVRLEHGDRLEPSAAWPDIFLVDACETFPIDLVFWRLRNEGLTRHRNPLFSRRSYVFPDTVAIDEVHTLHLGLFADYVLAVFWSVFDRDPWKLRRASESDESYLPKACLRLRACLFDWYKQRRRADPIKPMYDLGHVELSMLGTKASPSLTAKAGESGTLGLSQLILRSCI